MKGRVVTPEEFDRMIDKVESVTGTEATAAWKHYLRGLWWSGLRLRESLEVYWDRRDKLCVDLSGKRPMLHIPGALQKSGRDQLCPLAPEFATMLLETPESDRRGRVFRLTGIVNKKGGPMGSLPVTEADWVSRVVSRIGKTAGVVVDRKTKRVKETERKKVNGRWRKVPTGRMVDKEVTKFGSCHDMRRSFGFRWSRRILPPELKELMRHADISTTMAFYVGQDAQGTAESLWDAFEKARGNKVGNIGQNGENRAEQENEKTPEKQGLS